MKITSLPFYRVQSLKLDFHEDLNVFFGGNNAGKSTILGAIVIMLSWTVSRIHCSTSDHGHRTNCPTSHPTSHPTSQRAFPLETNCIIKVKYLCPSVAISGSKMECIP